MPSSLRSSRNTKPGLTSPEIKAEDESNAGTSGAVPSFKGRLNISDFAFTPSVNGGSADKQECPAASQRSSTRLSVQPEHETNTRANSSPKRKSGVLPLEGSSPMKRIRSPAGYAPPSTYAHLPLLPDAIGPNLLCLFIGLNPGIRTAVDGHAYAHPSNLFWKLLHSSGCTTRRCKAEEDQDLPRLFSLGSTNIVARPTRNASELSKAEMDASVHILEQKINKYKPEVVCTVGKSIWESVWRVKHGKPIKKEEFKYGWQDEAENMGRGHPGEEEERQQKWDGAKVFVATSTSGLAASLLPAEKERIWRELGIWVERRREEIKMVE